MIYKMIAGAPSMGGRRTSPSSDGKKVRKSCPSESRGRGARRSTAGNVGVKAIFATEDQGLIKDT